MTNEVFTKDKFKGSTPNKAKKEDEQSLQLKWIERIKEQIDFANSEALRDYVIQMKVAPRWMRDPNSQYQYRRCRSKKSEKVSA
jgi:hypothetical protein